MPRFNPDRLAELVTEESRLSGEVQELAVSLNEQHETDAWDEAKLAKYMADQQRHGQLLRERDSVRAERHRYAALEPATRAARDNPLARYLRRGEDGLEEGERAQFLTEREGHASAVANGPGFQIFGATQSDASSGQETVQEEIVPRVIDTLAYYGGVAMAARKFMTGTGGDYRFPQVDADAQEGRILGAQDTAVAAVDIPDIGIITFTSKTYTSDSIILTREMVQDAEFDIVRYVERQAVRRIGRISNKAFTATQTGSGMPEGVVTAAAAGVTAAAAAAIAWAETVNLVYTCNRAYREDGEGGEGGFDPEMGMVGYMISDDCEKVLRTLVDGDMRPLWLPSVREGVPSRYNGYPVIVNGHMDAVATGKVPMLFGNFGYYGIRTVRALEIFRFWDSRTAQKNTVECLAFARRDARYLGPKEAIRKLTMA